MGRKRVRGPACLPHKSRFTLVVMCKLKKANLFFLCFISYLIQAQEIPFGNPSFELDTVNQVLPAWYFLDIKGESPPDVQPCCFDVIKPAADGNTYLGMVARDNGTWEAIYQNLGIPLKAGNCYEFTVDLSQSFKYESVSRTNGKAASYNRPIRLLIWSSNKDGEHIEKLYSSPAINHADWRTYTIKIQASADVQSINFEAFYNDDFPYNGHLLLDHLSSIKQIACIDEEIPPLKFTKQEAQSMAMDLPSNFINLRNFFYYEREKFVGSNSNKIDLTKSESGNFPAYLESSVYDLYRWAELARKTENAKILIRQGIHPKTGLNFESEMLQSLIVYYLGMFGFDQSRIIFSYVEKRKYGRSKFPAILSLHFD